MTTMSPSDVRANAAASVAVPPVVDPSVPACVSLTMAPPAPWTRALIHTT